MANRSDNEHTIEILAELYPKTFFIDPPKRRPLSPTIKADIAKDIVADADSELRHENVNEAIDWYVSHIGYHKACINGASCVDLSGNVVAKVTANGAYQAKERLKEIYAKNSARDEMNSRNYSHNNVPLPVSPPRVPPPPISSAPRPRVLPVPPLESSVKPLEPATKRGRPLGSTKKKKEMANAAREMANATMDLEELLASINKHLKNTETLLRSDLDPKLRTMVVQPVLQLLISEIKLLQTVAA
jgi:sRNA-binding protein